MTTNIVDLKEGWRESGSGFAAPALPPTLIIKKHLSFREFTQFFLGIMG
jgi:hypothetical protein